jgi:hypothetical protein
MAIGDDQSSTLDSNSSTVLSNDEAENEILDYDLPEDFSPFFYLRDLLSAADLITVSLNMTYRLLRLDIPDDLRSILNLVPETDQLLALTPDFLQKLEMLKATAEGAMKIAAASDLAREANESLNQGA